MRTATIGSGSIADQLNATAILLKGCADLREIEYRWPRLVRALEGCADRAASVRSRGGEPANLDGSLAWLTEVIHAHPALEGPGGEPIRGELLFDGDWPPRACAPPHSRTRRRVAAATHRG